MKILHIQKVAGLAGSERYLQALLPALQASGVAVEFLSVSRAADQAGVARVLEPLRNSGIPVHEIHAQGALSLPLLRQMRNLIRGGAYTAVHTHLLHADTWGALCQLGGARFRQLSTKHGYEERYNDRFGFRPPFVRQRSRYEVTAQFAERWITRSAAVSHAVRNLYVRLGISKPSRIDVVWHGFDYAAPKPLAQPFAQRPVLVLAGRLVAFKGHRFVLDILPQLVQRYPGLQLLLLGNGPLEAALQAHVAELGMQAHVQFLGFTPNVTDYMAAADVVLVPSVSEGFGLVTLEAMNSGTPVVGFDVPATNEILVHGESGLLAQPYDTQQLCAHICHLLDHPESGRTLAAAANLRLKGEFSLARMVRDTIAFYERALR